MLRSGSSLGPFESIANTMHLGFRVSSRGALGHSWCFLGSPGLSLGHPWCILGFPGLSLEPLWGLPGDSLEPLWGLLGPPGDSQVTPWVLPVTPPGLPGTLPGLPVDSRGSPGTPRGPLGLSRDSLGTPGVSPAWAPVSAECQSVLALSWYRLSVAATASLYHVSFCSAGSAILCVVSCLVTAVARIP